VRIKEFKSDFYYLLDKFKSKENFAFLRFSDGEMFMLQDKEIILSNKQVKVEGVVDAAGPGHPEYDAKNFDPQQHSVFRDYLITSFLHNQNNYFKGISCKCCVGDTNFNWQLENLDGDHDNLTWANLLVNSNYPLFMKEFYPEIKTRGAYVICNEKADLSNLDWVKKDFKIKDNSFSNLSPILEIKDFIQQNSLVDQVFLFSASSFSNVAQYELFKEFPNNTYIDIGTTLSYEFKIPSKRGYLDQYYNNQQVTGNCIW
jgi:CRISPR/Cas system endoribonuclease Cas6 (RAMP superfamily)